MCGKPQIHEEAKPRKAKTQQKRFHPIVKWLRAVGSSAELFGWGGLMLTEWFWPAVGLIYGGFLLLIIDILFEPGFQNRKAWKVGALLGILLVMVLFSWGIVFVDAPIDFDVSCTDAEFPPGTTIAGITWRPDFSELQFLIKNSSDKAYRDVDLLIRPNEPVAAISQLTSVPGVYFEDKNGVSLIVALENLKAKTKSVLPIVLLASDAGYRMHCPLLPAKTAIRVIMAIADIKWNPKPRVKSGEEWDRNMRELINNKENVFRLRFEDFSTYWFGQSDSNVYAPRLIPNWVKVEGSYNVAYRTRSLSKKIEIPKEITIHVIH